MIATPIEDYSYTDGSIVVPAGEVVSVSIPPEKWRNNYFDEPAFAPPSKLFVLSICLKVSVATAHMVDIGVADDINISNTEYVFEPSLNKYEPTYAHFPNTGNIIPLLELGSTIFSSDWKLP